MRDSVATSEAVVRGLPTGHLYLYPGQCDSKQLIFAHRWSIEFGSNSV